jgi:hypothetical protein
MVLRLMRCGVALATLLAATAFAAGSVRAAVLTHAETLRCLDANNHQGVFLNACNHGSYQDWTPRLVRARTVTLVSGGTRSCLDANIHQGPFLNTCNGGAYQEWDTRSISGTTVSLVNVATQRCLDANIQQGVFLNTCNGGRSQRWQVSGAWAYCLVNCATGAPKPKPPTGPSISPSPSPFPSSSPSSSSSSSPSSSPPSSAVPPVTPSPPPVRKRFPIPGRTRAHLSLLGTPRSVINGRAVRLRGRVSGARVASGLVVLFQARVSPGHWITFGWARTRANGGFFLRYRFTRTTGRRTYLMRAFLPTQFGYRSRGSHSNTFRVRVTGPAT